MMWIIDACVGALLVVIGYLLCYYCGARYAKGQIEKEQKKFAIKHKKNMFETPLPQNNQKQFDKFKEMVDNSVNGYNSTTGLYEPKKTLKAKAHAPRVEKEY